MTDLPEHGPQKKRAKRADVAITAAEIAEPANEEDELGESLARNAGRTLVFGGQKP